MIVYGPKRYTELVDFLKLAAFLHMHGCPEDKIQTLRIRFVTSFPERILLFFLGRSLDCFHLSQHPEIELCWKSFEGIQHEGERLEKINAALLKECLRVCGRFQKNASLLFFLELFLSFCVFSILDIVCWQQIDVLPYPLFPGFFLPFQIFVILSFFRCVYLFSPSERFVRAKKHLSFWILSKKDETTEPVLPVFLPTEPTLVALSDLSNQKKEFDQKEM